MRLLRDAPAQRTSTPDIQTWRLDSLGSSVNPCPAATQISGRLFGARLTMKMLIATNSNDNDERMSQNILDVGASSRQPRRP